LVTVKEGSVSTGPANPTEEQLAALQACGRYEAHGVVILSTFVAALRDAREATGRDLKTGRVVHAEQSYSWLGAIAYLLLLESIGKWARPPGWTADPQGSGLGLTLRLFRPDVPEAELRRSTRCVVRSPMSTG